MQNSPARSSIDVGSVIAGTYIIEALIGRGGMGAVFLASHNRLPGKKVAIKVLHADLSGDEILGRFKREAQIASLLSHPNIVHIEDYNVTADGMPYLVLEYLQGESLAQRLRRGPLPLDQMFSFIRQVGSALAAAHAKGIVHRDLKPQNIFLVPSDIDGRTMEIAKVLDFGISKMRDSQTVKTQDTALLGTPQYMAPEQALGQHDRVDQRTDIFALGAIVYEMVSGQPAFSGQTIPEVVFKVVYEQPAPLASRVQGVSAAITSAVERAMTKSSADRFESVADFIEALTGSPVSVMRMARPLPAPDGGFATGSAGGRAPDGSLDVFAQTMASGDHGGTPLTRTAPAALPFVSGDAATMASQSGAVHDTVPSPSAAAPRSRRGPLLAGGLLAAAAAAAGIMYAVMREPAPPPARPVAQTPPPIASLPPDDTTDTPRATGSATPPTIVAVGSAEPPAPDVPASDPPAPPTPTPIKKPTGSHADKPQTPPPDDDTASDDTSTTAKKLREAHAALANRQWDAAQAAASFVLTAEDARKKQRAQAFMIQGIAQCAHHNNQEGGSSALRAIGALGRFPALEGQLITACRRAGVPISKR